MIGSSRFNSCKTGNAKTCGKQPEVWRIKRERKKPADRGREATEYQWK